MTPCILPSCYYCFGGNWCHHSKCKRVPLKSVVNHIQTARCHNLENLNLNIYRNMNECIWYMAMWDMARTNKLRLCISSETAEFWQEFIWHTLKLHKEEASGCSDILALIGLTTLVSQRQNLTHYSLLWKPQPDIDVMMV